MISRLTAIAATFAVIAAASMAFAANAHQGASTTASKPVRIVQLQDVTIVAKRLPQTER
jgi:hypothetical protein